MLLEKVQQEFKDSKQKNRPHTPVDQYRYLCNCAQYLLFNQYNGTKLTSQTTDC